MTEYDNYDLFAHHGYHARALTRIARSDIYLKDNHDWFELMDLKAALVLKALGPQFSLGGTEALESQSLWQVPKIAELGGLNALRKIGKPVEVITQAKGRLFAA
jgi:type I restriction enzyme R subunit